MEGMDGTDGCSTDGSSFYDLDSEDDHRKPPKPRKKRNKLYKPGVLTERLGPNATVNIDFDKVADALEVLKEPFTKKKKRRCAKAKVIHYRTQMCYPAAIARAIYTRNWKSCCELLQAYVHYRKNRTGRKFLFTQYLVHYLLNDPVAVQNQGMHKYISARLPGCTQEQLQQIVKRLTTISTKPIKVEKKEL